LRTSTSPGPARVPEDRGAPGASFHDAVKCLFVVRCAGCERTLLTVDRIRDAEIAALETHLRRCGQAEPLEAAPPLAEVMRRIRVAPLESKA